MQNLEYNLHPEIYVPFNSTDMSNLKDRMHDELKNTTQAKYCTNTVCSIEITLQKPHKNAVQKSDHETEHPSVQGYMVNEFKIK